MAYGYPYAWVAVSSAAESKFISTVDLFDKRGGTQEGLSEEEPEAQAQTICHCLEIF